MGNLKEKLLGLVRGAGRYPIGLTPEPQPARTILGATAAKELCMLPVDCTPGLLFAKDAKRVVQTKMDGIRGLYLDRIVTREGTPLDCALHCQPGLRRLEETFGHEMFFDGEYMEDDGFNATLSAQGKREGTGTFWIFDAVPRGAWITGGSDIPLVARLTDLKARFHALGDDLGPFVGMLDWWMLDEHSAAAKAAELWQLGYEGIVSKRADSPYVRDRSPDWVRVKRTITSDLPIVDIIRERDTLKAIIVRSPDGPIRIGRGWDAGQAQLIVNAFSTNNHVLRAERALEASPITLRPMLAEISYQLTTGTKRSVRGATFHRLRLDKETTL